MADAAEELHGIVRGKLIELERSPGLPDGEAVIVRLRPVRKPGDGIRRSAGAWAEGEELNKKVAAVLQDERGRRRPTTTGS